MMTGLSAQNLIFGRPRSAARSAQFQGWTLPESDERDVSAALKAARSQPLVPIDAAVEALADIGGQADWITDDHLMKISGNTGSAMKYLRTSIARLNEWLASIGEFVSRHGVPTAYGIRTPDGVLSGGIPTTLVLAGDATAVGPLALAHTVLAGARVVAKGSRFEPLAPYLFLRALADRGIPVPQLLFFDSSSDTGRGLLTTMIEHTAQSVIYGADRTISGIYGRASTDAAHKKIGFWAGRSGILVLPDADPEVAGRCIAVGTGEDRGNRCYSTMKAFVPAKIADAVLENMVKAADGMVRGDPLDPRTDIGVLPAQARREAAESVGTAELIYDRDMMFVRCDPGHYLLREELPYPICAIRVYDDREDIAEVVNATVRDSAAGRGLALSVVTRDPSRLMPDAGRLAACKIIFNRPTTDLDHMYAHQGIYLFKELMRFSAVELTVP